MNRYSIITGILLVLTVQSPAPGGYQEMQSEIRSYSPPLHLERWKQSETLSPPSEDAEIEAVGAKLRNMAAKWEQKGEISGGDDESFVRPDPQALKRLRPAASDPAAAAAALQERFDLESLEILTLLRNPEIGAARNRVRAAAAAFSQVSNLDEILRQYTAFTEGQMTGVGPMKGMDSVKMKFPFPGVTTLKGEVVDQAVRAAAEDLEIARRDTVTAARKAYWNLLHVHRAIAVQAETLDLFRNLEAVANSRYRSGNTSFQDVIKVGIRTKVLEEDLKTLRGQRRNREVEILKLLDLPPDTAVGPPETIRSSRNLPELDHLYGLAREKRQEIRRMRAMIGRMERMIEMAETMTLPPFTLDLSVYETNEISQTGTAAMKPAFPEGTTASTGAGLPKMPWYGTSDPWLRQTRLSLTALRQDLRKVEAATIDKVRNAWFALDKAIRETALYQNTVVELSRSALDVSTRGYESGTVTFADVIGSYTTWLDVRLALARKRSDIGVARAELEQTVGTALE